MRADEGAVLDADRRLMEARRTLDRATYEALVDARFVGVDAGGAVTTKEARLAGFASVRYASLDVRERQVRVVEGVGLVTATMEAIGDHGGERFEGTYRYTHVYVRRDGAWLLVSAHACGLVG